MKQFSRQIGDVMFDAYQDNLGVWVCMTEVKGYAPESFVDDGEKEAREWIDSRNNRSVWLAHARRNHK